MRYTFRHKHKNHVGGLSASAARFVGRGDYHAHYGLTDQPQAGADRYAYESLGLVPYTPIGPGQGARASVHATAKPLYVLQSIPVAGLGGIVAGQMIGQPLFNPYSGYSGYPPLPVSAFPPNIVDPSQLKGML